MSILAKAKSTVNNAKETLSRYESGNPHTAGQVRRAVGGVLIADGLVGLENPFDGRKTRPGIAGAMAGVVFGLVFVAAAVVINSLGPETDAEVTGQVVSVDGSETCSLTADFTVDGTSYTARSTGSSSTNCSYTAGDPVTVQYNSADPSQSTTEESMLGIFALIFGGVGVLVALGGLFTTVVRAASIVFGFTLWRSGSKMVKANPRTADDAGVVEEARQVITRLLTAKEGLAQGMLGATLGGARRREQPEPPRTPEQPQQWRPQPEAPRPPQQTAPVVAPSEPIIAAGWYLTEDQRHYRWYDGTSWTAHTRPAQAPSAPDQAPL